MAPLNTPLIVPALFSFFIKDLNVLPSVLFTITYRLSILSIIQTCVWPFQNQFEKLFQKPQYSY